MQDQRGIGRTRAEHGELARRALIVAAVACGLFLFVALVWARPEVPLVLFASYLFAVAVRFASDRVAARLGIGARPAVLLVVFSLLILGGLGTYLLAKPLVAQVEQLAGDLPATAKRLLDQVRAHPWGQKLMPQTPDVSAMSPTTQGLLKLAPGVFGGALDAAAMIVVWFFVGFYGAWDPEVYQRGLLYLFPRKKRPRIARVCRDAAANVGRWLVARFVAMAVCGVLTFVGLWLLHVPLALALAVVAGLFAFVDYVGAVASAVPAILVALGRSPALAFGTLIVFVVVHIVEGYLLTPWLVRRAVHAPPAFTLGMQLLLGAVFGIAGIVLANPLTVVLLVIVQRLYVEDALDENNVGPVSDG
jgi:predicted PurR-regulated permease PerM